MLAIIFTLLLSGIVLLVSAEFLVKGAVRLSTLCNISPLIIGATVVAFGTSAPELSVSAIAALNGKSELAIGNILGSNVCNTFLILGLSAAISPLLVKQLLLLRELPFLLMVSVLAYWFSLDGTVELTEGLILFALLLVYTIGAIYFERREPKAIEEEYEEEFAEERGKLRILFTKFPVLGPLLAVVVGLLGLVYGADLFTEAASKLARLFGVSDTVIGLTIVALGTSLPEVVTSAVAAFRGEGDIALGNILGSNLFNLLCVLGVTAIIHPVSIPEQVLAIEYFIVIGSVLLCFPVLMRERMARIDGVIFILFYVLYLAYQVLANIRQDMFEHVSGYLLYGVIPFLVVGILIPKGKIKSAN